MRYIERLVATHSNKPEKIGSVAEVKHRHGSSVASLECTRATNSSIYIIMRKEKAPIYKLSRRKAPKTQQICHYKHATKTSRLFLLYDMGIGFNSRNNFSNLGSFAKVSAPL